MVKDVIVVVLPAAAGKARDEGPKVASQILFGVLEGEEMMGGCHFSIH